MSVYEVETDNGVYEVEVEDAPETPKSPDLASTLYHGAIEGAAMTVGGLAGAALGSPAGPIGSAAAGVGMAAAMYPPAKRAAEAIDRYRGITPPPQPNIAQEYGEGLAIEATGAALKPAMRFAGKMLPGARSGEALSGTPEQNLKRAYQQGFKKTYIDPKPLAEASERFGQEKLKLAGDLLSPEEQVAMTVNPRGEANQKLSDVMLRWMKNEPISPQDALAAKQAAGTVFPADTAGKQAQRGALSQFKTAMNEILDKESPSMAQASRDYAASKLRKQLMMPARVNKNNPEQFSKLGAMLTAAPVGLYTGTIVPAVGVPAVGVALGTSPLAMGITASLAGDLSRLGLGNPFRRALAAAYIDRITSKEAQ